MLTIDISDDVARVRRRMTTVARQELPFALALALTGAAFDIRKEAVERVGPDSFDMRDRRFLRAALRVEKATKANMTAKVYDALESSDLELHARGKVKYPFNGRRLAVPTKHLLPKRGARGVPKAWRPAQAMRKKRVFVNRWRGHEYIWRRRTKKRYPIEPLYLLVPRARMPRRFPFYERARDMFRSQIDGQLDRALRRAIKSRQH